MCSVMRDRGRGGSEAQAHPSRPTPGRLAVWEHHRTWPLGALCPTYSTSIPPYYRSPQTLVLATNRIKRSRSPHQTLQ